MALLIFIPPEGLAAGLLSTLSDLGFVFSTCELGTLLSFCNFNVPALGVPVLVGPVLVSPAVKSPEKHSRTVTIKK
jgi:hypothetical protein